MKKNVIAFNLAMAVAATSFQIPMCVSAEDVTDATYAKMFDFEDGSTMGWYYGSGWEWQYSGAKNSSIAEENGLLKVNTDFSADVSADWSNLAICYYEQGMDLSNVTKLTADVYYETSKLTDGSLKLGVYSNAGVDTYSELSSVATADTQTGLSKAEISFSFNPLGGSVDDIAIKIVGLNTSYKGAVYFDNIRLSCDTSNSFSEDTTVTSTIMANSSTSLSLSDNKLNINGKSSELSTNISLVDADATNDVKALYSYLQTIGNSNQVIYGHQDDTFHKAGSSSLTCSDTSDVTGSVAGVLGIDALALTGAEYSASEYNSSLSSRTGITVPETAAGNVQAAALITNDAIKDGSIITLSAHMPNFSKVKKIATDDPVHSYAGYDFSGYTPNDLSGDVMNQLLPGGQYNAVYNAYLDMIADYASQVDGAILFRPFHECTGGWFWWGTACCDAETYKSVFKYTVSYMRDTKNVHNMLYAYGPGSEATDVDDYAVRYPGDEYVDLVGFDMYDRDPVSDENGYTFMADFEKELGIVDAFATAHNKLIAVTECGVATSHADPGDNQTALHHSNNAQPDWYNKILDITSRSHASYFLLWANFSKNDGFYTPFVDSINEDGSLNGHEMLDNFISFYNDERSVFATDQKEVISALPSSEVIKDLSVASCANGLSGYITAPVASKRVNNACTFSAILNSATVENISFVLHGNTDVTIPAIVNGKEVHADVTLEKLRSVGSTEGTISLVAGDKVLSSINVIFNMEEAVQTPETVDDFDKYYGYSSIMLKNWNTNHADNSTIKLDITDSKDVVDSGEYALRFEYSEGINGWAGTTILKDVDWSNYNALSFYTTPDGNNQKVVIQITANGKVYETYLNNYEAYRDTTDPLKVIIPFSAFCERDTAGNPTGNLVNDCFSISSIGLWVNAIEGTGKWIDGKVSGTIYYDSIKAVNSSETEVNIAPVSNNSTDADNRPSSENKTTDLKKASISKINDVTYTGKALTPSLKIVCNSKTLKAGRDYTVTYKNNINPGKASFTVKGVGNYSGSISGSFTIVKAEATIKNVKSSYTKTLGDNAFSIRPTCKSNTPITFSSSDKKVATIDKNGKIKLVGAGTCKITISARSNKYYGSATKKIQLTVRPKKVAKFSSKQSSDKLISLSWSKDKTVTGYVIEYSTSKSFSAKTTTTKKVKGATVSSVKIKKKAGQKYYVRIRSYKKSGSSTIYSNYSSVKTIL